MLLGHRRPAPERARHHFGRPLRCQHGAAIEGVEQHRIGAHVGAHDEVAGQSDAQDAQPHAPADLHHEHGQRDGNPEPAVEDVVETAVARIVVVLAVAAEAFLFEEELAQPVERLHTVAHGAGA